SKKSKRREPCGSRLPLNLDCLACLRLRHGRKKYFRGRQELHVWNFGDYPHALELSLLPAVAHKGEQVLVSKVCIDFVEVWLQRNWHTGTEVKGLGAGLFRKTA